MNDLSQEDEKELAAIRERTQIYREDCEVSRFTWGVSQSDRAFLLRLYDTLRRKVEVLEKLGKVCETCGGGEDGFVGQVKRCEWVYSLCPGCIGLGVVSKHAERLRAADKLREEIQFANWNTARDAHIARLAMDAYDAAVKQEKA